MQNLYSPFRYYRDQRPRISGRRRFRKISDQDLYQMVKNEVTKRAYPVSFKAEGLANQFQVPIHRITQIFQRLNGEGLMRQRVNRMSQDFKWYGSTYATRPRGTKPC